MNTNFKIIRMAEFIGLDISENEGWNPWENSKDLVQPIDFMHKNRILALVQTYDHSMKAYPERGKLNAANKDGKQFKRSSDQFETTYSFVAGAHMAAFAPEVFANAMLEVLEETQRFPSHEEEYYFVDEYGDVEIKRFLQDGDSCLFDKATGNCFRTSQEARDHKERMLVHAELTRLAQMNDPDGKGAWYAIMYKHKGDMFYVLPCSVHSSFTNNTHFRSKEFAEYAIESIGEDRLKLYFGVTDEN